MPGARTRGPRVGRKYCRRGQEMRFFMITRHHTGDGKYFEPIVNIMTEGVLRLWSILAQYSLGHWAACVGRCSVMSEKLPRRNVMPRYSEQCQPPAPLTLRVWCLVSPASPLIWPHRVMVKRIPLKWIIDLHSFEWTVSCILGNQMLGYYSVLSRDVRKGSSSCEDGWAWEKQCLQGVCIQCTLCTRGMVRYAGDYCRCPVLHT